MTLTPVDRGSLRVSLDGITDLPPGKIAAIVTYLEMWGAPAPATGSHPRWSLTRIDDVLRYRALYRRVGEPWLWFSRRLLSDAALAAILGDPRVEALALRDDRGSEIGLLELDFRVPGECEIAFLGLVAEAIGSGTGRVLMGEAIRRAFERPVERLFVHTCTLDHPGALAFYVRSGFRPYKRAIEIADDPRLTGALPRDAAPHAPVIETKP